jgi:WD40 repeat protein
MNEGLEKLYTHKEERGRQTHELALQKRAARNLRFLVAALAGFLLVATGLAAWALSEGTAARSNFTRAEAQRLAAEANNLVQTNGSPELVALLALRSIGTQYSPQGDAALEAAARLEYPRQNYVGHASQINFLDISRDGRYMTSGGFDSIVKLWDAKSGKVLQQYPGRSNKLSTDSRYVLSVQPGNASAPTTYVRLWDRGTGKELVSYGSYKGTTWSDLSADGKRVVVDNRDNKTITEYDAQSGQVLLQFTDPTADELWQTIYSPDRKYIFTGGQAATLWDAQTGLEVQRFEGHAGVIYRAAFSPDGKYVLTGSLDKTAILWDTQTGLEVHRFAGYTDQIGGVAFSPDGKRAIIGSFDGTAILWDTQTGLEVRRFNRQPVGVTSVAYSPDGTYVVIGSGTSLVAWDVQLRKGSPELVGHADSVQEVALSPDGRYVLTSSADKTAKLWDAQTGKEVKTFTGHRDEVTGAAFSPDGKQILTGSSDETALLWDTQTAQPVLTFTGHQGTVYGVAISPDGKHALTGSLDKTAILWDVGTGKQIHLLTNHTDQVQAVAFSPDGRYALTGSIDQTAILWDVITGREVLSYPGNAGGVGTVGFSGDGKQVLIGSVTATRLLERDTGEEIRQFPGCCGRFSPDGKYVLTEVASDNTTRVWEAGTGAELRRLADPSGALFGWAFSRDSKHVLTTSQADSKVVRMWNTDYRDTIRFLCGALIRDLTDEEREQFSISDNKPTCP